MIYTVTLRGPTLTGAQNLTVIKTASHNLPALKIWSKSLHSFLSYFANTYADKYTNGNHRTTSPLLKPIRRRCGAIEKCRRIRGSDRRRVVVKR